MTEFDLQLVRGLEDVPTEVAKKVMTNHPVVAYFRKDGRELWYAAPLHQENEDSPGFALLRRIFERASIACVVVEGSPFEQGELSGRYLREMIARNEKGLYENGERGYAAKLASERGIPVIGGEPSDRELAACLLKEGWEPRDALGIGFICYIPQWNRLGLLDRFTIEELFNRDMPAIRRAQGLESAPAFEFSDLLRWYLERNGEPLDPCRVADIEPHTPLANGKLGTQRISHVMNMVRNRAIARVINERINKDSRVLGVFGNGHLACHWRMLLSTFGEPVCFGDLSDGNSVYANRHFG